MNNMFLVSKHDGYVLNRTCIHPLNVLLSHTTYHDCCRNDSSWLNLTEKLNGACTSVTYQQCGCFSHPLETMAAVFQSWTRALLIKSWYLAFFRWWAITNPPSQVISSSVIKIFLCLRTVESSLIRGRSQRSFCPPQVNSHFSTHKFRKDDIDLLFLGFDPL